MISILIQVIYTDKAGTNHDLGSTQIGNDRVHLRYCKSIYTCKSVYTTRMTRGFQTYIRANVHSPIIHHFDPKSTETQSYRHLDIKLLISLPVILTPNLQQHSHTVILVIRSQITGLYTGTDRLDTKSTATDKVDKIRKIR